MSSLDLAVSARRLADPVKASLPNPHKTCKAHYTCLHPGCPHSGSARLGLFRTPALLLKHCLKCHPDTDFLLSVVKELSRDIHGMTYTQVAMPSAEALNGREADSLDLTAHDLELLLPVFQALTELPGMDRSFKCCAYCLIIHLGACTPHICNESAVVIPPASTASNNRQPITLPRVPVYILSSDHISDPSGWKYHKEVEHKDVAAYYNGAAVADQAELWGNLPFSSEGQLNDES
ncbi:hypothetical protein CEUSTIGMA_g12900.t1 [Chlamydomonas eustigma]|uniref:Uncharacterized protein n=1 Tax=Chlamydomonas eustigma TaxID=1157962 RepID=A0A250XQZ8_9CHLO|nr:hypothetical protein CEUSTIGMA_g12900.t1 [Chlamydomonas eustigma]|eukprot:GAX85484.1 hypothetical protein CEUSTIGMA_g12900.t1 [Chlamydomonas eustigma]